MALHGLHAASVVEDLLVRVVQHLVGVPDLCEPAFGLLVRVLVGVILDRQLPVDLLDVRLVGVVWQAEDAVEVLLQLGGLKVKDALEGGLAPLAVRCSSTLHSQALHLGLVLLLWQLPGDAELVQPCITPEDVHLAVRRGGPLAKSALTVLRRRVKAPVLLELHVPPAVPVPLGALHPVHRLGNVPGHALRELGLLPPGPATHHLERSAVAHLELEPSAAPSAAKRLAEDLLDERPCRC
mmetsp:Transcript_33544/g.104568  ORF Transcript_33544/g.104568 Transcript_33544/m.104568 type:complete len:239 (-) Transcript_33544:103-819(-)